MQKSALSVSQLGEFGADSQILAIQPELNSIAGPALRLKPGFARPTFVSQFPIRLKCDLVQTVIINFLAHCGNRFVVRLQNDNITASCSPLLTKMEEEVYCCILQLNPYRTGAAMSQLEVCLGATPIIYVILYFDVEKEQKPEDTSVLETSLDRHVDQARLYQSNTMSVALNRKSEFESYCTETSSLFSPEIMQTSHIKHTGRRDTGLLGGNTFNGRESSRAFNDFLPPSMIYNSQYAKNGRVPRIRGGVLGKSEEVQTYFPAVSSVIQKSVEKLDSQTTEQEKQLPVYPGATITNPERREIDESERLSQGSMQRGGSSFAKQQLQRSQLSESIRGQQSDLSRNSTSNFKKRLSFFGPTSVAAVPQQVSALDDSSPSDLSQEFVFHPLQTIPGQLVFAPASADFPEVAKLRIKSFIGTEICCVAAVEATSLSISGKIQESVAFAPDSFEVDTEQVKIPPNGTADITVTFKPREKNKIVVSVLRITHLDTEITVPLFGCAGCALCDCRAEDGMIELKNSGQCDLLLNYESGEEQVKTLLQCGEVLRVDECEKITYISNLLERLESSDFAPVFRLLKAQDWEDQVRRVVSICEETWENPEKAAR